MLASACCSFTLSLTDDVRLPPETKLLLKRIFKRDKGKSVVGSCPGLVC